MDLLFGWEPGLETNRYSLSNVTTWPKASPASPLTGNARPGPASGSGCSSRHYSHWNLAPMPQRRRCRIVDVSWLGFLWVWMVLVFIVPFFVWCSGFRFAGSTATRAFSGRKRPHDFQKSVCGIGRVAMGPKNVLLMAGKGGKNDWARYS